MHQELCVRVLPMYAMVNSFVIFPLDYCNTVFLLVHQPTQLDRPQAVQNAAARQLCVRCLQVWPHSSTHHRLRLHWLPVHQRILESKMRLLTLLSYKLQSCVTVPRRPVSASNTAAAVSDRIVISEEQLIELTVDATVTDFDRRVFIHIHTFIIEWQHKHAGFKTKHNAQSISQ